MKISFYELLKLVNEKKAPLKIVYNDKVYKFDNKYTSYDVAGYPSLLLQQDIPLKDMLVKNIVILEN